MKKSLYLFIIAVRRSGTALWDGPAGVVWRGLCREGTVICGEGPFPFYGAVSIGNMCPGVEVPETLMVNLSYIDYNTERKK